MENFNVEFAKRMEIVVKRLGSVSELARRVDVAYPTATKWVKEGAEPSTTNLIKITEAAGVNLLWLATGQGAMLKADSEGGEQQTAYDGERYTQPILDTLDRPVDIEEFVFIPRYNVKVAAGHGYIVEDEKPRFTMAFRRYWIRVHLRTDPKSLSVVKVAGDSMEGVLFDGDNVLVDHSRNQPGNGLYVLRIGEELIVKRTQTLPGSHLLVSSANEAYQPFELDLADETSGVEIIGKVVWFGRQI
ncbi:XRE family transcriptional regulator [Eikenella corrodens]|uniref:XRE family transcriptional regulator n=1 Tax=Eikenella corrodens TaxID=539 RepID=UPI0007D048BD|nr:helix-turn-helix transcriptional regulator [Eikenella corrodens]OAM33958.1 repressor [Eikenella corrodens]